MSVEAGYDPAVVFDWLDTFGTKAPSGRYTTLCGRVLEDTHRDTFDRWREWRADPAWRVPLVRLDEILCYYGAALWEFESYAEAAYGWNGFLPTNTS